MKYLVQTENIANEKRIYDENNKVILDKTNGEVYINYGYNLIDFGLPSGNLWTDRNIGATNIYDEGLYFAWGETEGYTKSEIGIKRVFDWDTYKYGSYKNLSKYNTTDKIMFLKNEDDAAYQYTNGRFKIPSLNDFQELMYYTSKFLIAEDGSVAAFGQYENDYVTWYYYTSRDTSIKGTEFRKRDNSSVKMFIPSQVLNTCEIFETNTYWGTNYTYYNDNKYRMDFGSVCERCQPFPIRAVKTK